MRLVQFCGRWSSARGWLLLAFPTILRRGETVAGSGQFFRDDDYQAYLDLVGEWCSAHDVEIWAYCLMPNHVHLIAVPESADGLRRRPSARFHRRYTLWSTSERVGVGIFGRAGFASSCTCWTKRYLADRRRAVRGIEPSSSFGLVEALPVSMEQCRRLTHAGEMMAW